MGELCDLHMDFSSEVRVNWYPSSERVMFPAPGKWPDLGLYVHMYVVIFGIILLEALCGEWFQWLRLDRRLIRVKQKEVV